MCLFVRYLYPPGILHFLAQYSSRSLYPRAARYNNRLVMCVLLSKTTDDNPIKLVQTLKISSFDATYDEIKTDITIRVGPGQRIE